MEAFAISADPGSRFIFGSDTESNDITANITPEYLSGWLEGLNPDGYPPLEWFNAAFFTHGQILSYIHQIGVVEWNAAQEYDTNSYCNYSGKLYISLTDLNIGNTPGASPSNWISASAAGLIYDPTYTYAAGDFVAYNNILYYSLLGANQGNTPSSSPTYWKSIFVDTALTGNPTCPTQVISDNSTKIANTAFVAAAIAAAGTPSGKVDWFAMASAPAGWLVCNGSAVSRTTYSALFAAIGTTWGVGDGSTTFNLPNLQRAAAVGAGGTASGVLSNTVGSTGGVETLALSVPNLPAHNHAVTDPSHRHVSSPPPDQNVSPAYPWGASGTGIGVKNTTGGNATYAAALTSPSGTGISIQNTGSGTPISLMQPSAVLLACIKT